MLSIVLAACGSEGDPVDDVDNVSPDPVTSVSFAKGADISWASEMERDGISFSDSKGGKDIFQVVKNLGHPLCLDLVKLQAVENDELVLIDP